MSSPYNVGITRRAVSISATSALVALMFAGGGAMPAQAKPAVHSIPTYITAAIANPARPDADRKVDDERKPADLIAFSGLKPGDSIAELIPGGGYFTRIFSNVVAPSGHVYEIVTQEEVSHSAKAADPIRDIAANPAFPGVTVLVQPIASFSPPQKVDMVWTTQNYHDLHDRAFGPADMVAFNKAVFNALKPGGVFFVVDHAAAPGSGLRDTQTLHRIDPASVKKEVEAAGFVLEAQSNILRNPADDHTLHSSNPAIRGKSDKFILKFVKPRAKSKK